MDAPMTLEEFEEFVEEFHLAANEFRGDPYNIVAQQRLMKMMENAQSTVDFLKRQGRFPEAAS